MKLQFPLAIPTRANGALVPALCAAMLALLAALQFALTSDIELPEQGWSGGAARAEMPQIAGRSTPPILRTASIFSPTRTAQGEGTTGAALQLGGAAVAGTITVRGRSYAVVQRPDGQLIRLPVGGRLGGMQLIALLPEGAVFMAEGKRVQIAFGSAMLSTPATPAADIEEEQE